MTSIGASLGNAYYSLTGQNSASTAVPSLTTQFDNADTTVAPPASLASNAYLLDLSPQAQSLLDGATSAQSAATGSDSGSFVLNDKQKQQIAAILDKYKDAPQTQDTYNKIQDDLKAAGLSPDQLALQDKLQSFSATQVLIDALSGQQTAPTTDTSDDAEKTKSANYMQDVLKQWQSISTQPASPDTSTASGASA